MLRGKEATLAAIITIIMEEEPETQDDIAEKLNVSRRYVAKLLKPLVDEGAIRHPYVVNLEKLKNFEEYLETDKFFKEISDTFDKMGTNVIYNAEKVFEALKKQDIDSAKNVILEDYALNRMEDEVNIVLRMNASKHLDMDSLMQVSNIAANIERCGDYLSNIAEEVVNGLLVEPLIYLEIFELHEIIVKMFNYAMDMVKHQKINTEIYELELKLHEKLDIILEKLKSERVKKSENINQFIQFGMFLKDVERFGDRCLKIFELGREFHHKIPQNKKIPESFRNIK
ncbi:phosphate uptake regulator, PhoU [Methanococcus vannielii SB]|uniref:Phosphate uptake regulator, PhoU n=1 Tax=Methanococcus vannielii (strain ATCC 35089 / DSM 1224 / JCM 13029 / OCM 148 / SB) TaxID=406327 RepID=A6UPJ9_METVS|nr:PhoU domain-containing protein [Methanococcus vannielii]ABR54421.1 phosphate uptake regulator, PhoU [Methanococcus vannielii SB]